MWIIFICPKISIPLAPAGSSQILLTLGSATETMVGMQHPTNPLVIINCNIQNWLNPTCSSIESTHSDSWRSNHASQFIQLRFASNHNAIVSASLMLHQRTCCHGYAESEFLSRHIGKSCASKIIYHTWTMVGWIRNRYSLHVGPSERAKVPWIS